MDNRKEFLRDPFRAVMMALPKARGLAALCAAVCAVFFFGALACPPWPFATNFTSPYPFSNTPTIP